MEKNCLKCGLYGCIKCTKYIMMETRLCVDDCPSGYSQKWSSTSDLMGRICQPSPNVHNVMQTALIGIVCGALLCFLIILMGVVMLRRKQQKIHRKSTKDQLIDDEYDRHEFIRQLDELRPHAEHFLFMLNDTRKQIRKAYITGDTTASSARFYPIIRDLAKILILLNRPVELIDGPPHDWNRLLLWAERILNQYKPQQQQITQLIDILQQSSPTPASASPILNHHRLSDDDARLVSKHTTFKSLFYSTPVIQTRKSFQRSTLPPSMTLSTVTSDIENEEKNVDESLISLQDFGGSSTSVQHHPQNTNKVKFRNSQHEQSDGDYGESFEHVKNYLSSGSLLVVEDELIEFKLGLRPQDEITTEL